MGREQNRGKETSWRSLCTEAKGWRPQLFSHRAPCLGSGSSLEPACEPRSGCFNRLAEARQSGRLGAELTGDSTRTEGLAPSGSAAGELSRSWVLMN